MQKFEKLEKIGEGIIYVNKLIVYVISFIMTQTDIKGWLERLQNVLIFFF